MDSGHPIHIHGAGRFPILSRDGEVEPNLVWKDTTGQGVDPRRAVIAGHAAGEAAGDIQTPPGAAVELYWIPLGAGDRCVRFGGRAFETIDAALRRRSRCELYHAALTVDLDGDRHTIELAPSPDADEAGRGVVATGAVGSRYLAWSRRFRYELRCWRGGSIPDLRFAVGGPRRVTSDPEAARRLLALAPAVPTPVWGRDELGAGEMWNSNSVIAWLLASAGLPAARLSPPLPGRAPGWHAGIDAALGPHRSRLDRPAAGYVA